MTGYLTKARADDYKSEIPRWYGMHLMIPNAEIKEIFETTVIRSGLIIVRKSGIEMLYLMLFGTVTV